jgi:hypothetical protein
VDDDDGNLALDLNDAENDDGDAGFDLNEPKDDVHGIGKMLRLLFSSSACTTAGSSLVHDELEHAVSICCMNVFVFSPNK